MKRQLNCITWDSSAETYVWQDPELPARSVGDMLRLTDGRVATIETVDLRITDVAERTVPGAPPRKLVAFYFRFTVAPDTEVVSEAVKFVMEPATGRSGAVRDFGLEAALGPFVTVEAGRLTLKPGARGNVLSLGGTQIRIERVLDSALASPATSGAGPLYWVEIELTPLSVAPDHSRLLEVPTRRIAELVAGETIAIQLQMHVPARE